MIGSNSVTDQTVGATTTLNFQLFLPTLFVNQGDYLVIQLPSNQGVSFVSGKAFCTIQSPLSATTCSILTIQSARITFSTGGSNSVQSLQGSIRDFKNPQSTITVTNIQYSLYSSTNSNTPKAVFLTGSLSNFIPTTVTVSITSGSNIVGAQTSLFVNITPKFILPANGSVSIQFPDYYLNSGQQQYIGSTNPGCSGQAVSYISCTYNFASKTLILTYQFSNGLDRTTLTQFTIQSFNNPISPVPRAGFIVTTIDQNGNEIAKSTSLTLSGVVSPATFKSFQFQFLTSNGIGAYTSFAIALGLSVPVEQNCFVKFVFPAEFILDSQLFQLEGSGYFIQAGSTSQKVPWLSLNITSKEIVVAGCQQTFGANLIGTLQFQQIKNPNYLNGTGSFQIVLSKDKDFTQVIMQQTTGLNIPSSSFSPGAILQTQIKPTSAVVSTQTSYQFTFTPTNPLGFVGSGGSKIEVTFPHLLQLSSTCSLTQISFQFGSSATCSISGQVVTINNPFTNKNFTGNSALSFTISRATNPISVRPLGIFTINTFVLIGQTYFQVDGIQIQNGVVLLPGLVSAKQGVSSSSLVTCDKSAVYTFQLLFEHLVPIGSSVVVTLPTGMSIINQNQFQQSCKKTDGLLLSCIYLNQTQFSVSINVAQFQSGIRVGDVFAFQISGIQNPRLVGTSYQFVVFSNDILGFLMDKSVSDPMFNIQMTTPGFINSLAVSASNTTNGATTTYSITISSNTPILNGDQLRLTFPSEIRLPSSSNIQCSGQSSQITQIQCVNLGNNEVIIYFITVRSILADTSFTIQIQGIKNSASLRPSSPFSNLRIADSQGIQISTFKGLVRVTNFAVSNIQIFSLIQSTREPGKQADYTIRFTTVNPLPSTASILITTPLNVAIVPISNPCYVVTNTQSINVCNFIQSTAVQITNAFRQQTTSYEGVVSVNFQAYNPPDNSSPTTSLVLTIFDDATFTFKIDQITSGLNPTFTCSYPCASCDYQNAAQCITCPQGLYDPKYLQRNLTTGLTTCVSTCSPGYTSSTSSQPLTCMPCDPSCATCQSGGGPINQQTCLSCSSKFPVYWQQGAKCYPTSLGCPVGTFTSNVNRCTSCTAPCLNCTSPTVCSVCDPLSNAPLLSNKVCVSKCLQGFTPVFTGGKGICQSCQSPCATCADGLPTKCQSCANGTLQFLFGSQCVAQCPLGTSTNMTSKMCTGCQQGCDLCQTTDNSYCIKCASGLSLLEGQCLSECPPTHQKSSDGANCELRQYPLNQVFVPFPFLLLLVILHLIILASWRITKYRTLITQNSICAISVVLVLAIGFQLLRAFIELQPLIIVMNIVMLAGGLIVNVAYIITFRIQIDDYQFNQYKQYHMLAFTIVMGICCVISLHVFRIMYGKLFALPVFYAEVTDCQTFYRPLLLYSLIQIVSISTPIILANIYFIVASGSNYILTNQLQMTNIEVLVISILLIGLVLFERFFQHPKYIAFKPNDMDAVQFVQSFEDKKDRMEQSSRRLLASQTELLANSDYVPLQEKLDRHQELIEIIRQIRGNRNNGLNVNLDRIIELDMNQINDKIDTDPSPRLETFQSDYSELEKANQSFPGCNPVWRDDGTDKRLELLQWMELQVEINAERERLQLEEAAKLQRFQEKETMYDNNLFDNVFFSSKSHRDIEVQPDIEPISYVDNFAQFDHEEETQRNLLRKLEKQEIKQKAKIEKKELKAQQRIERLKSAAAQTEKLQLEEKSAQGRSDIPSQQSIVKKKTLSKNSTKNYASQNNNQSDQSVDQINSQQADQIIEQSQKSIAKNSQATKMNQQNQLQEVTSKSQFSKRPTSSYKAVIAPQTEGLQNQKAEKSQYKNFNEERQDQLSEQYSSFSKKQSIKSSSQAKAAPVDFDFSSQSDGQEPEVVGDEQASKHQLEDESQLSLNITSNQETFIQKSLKQQQSMGALQAMPETMKWMHRVKLMKTLMLDGREPRRRPQTAGIYIRSEEQQHSETEKTLLDKIRSQALEQTKLQEEEINTDEEDFYKNGMADSYDESYTTLRSEEKFRNDFDNRYRDNIFVNQRNFNIFEVLGNFPLDNYGRIIDRTKTLLEADFHDIDGQLVNEYGYLINEQTGFIRSRYTYEDLFKPIQNSIDERGELPMPFRLERHNFNPHKILGNFDFDAKTRKPVFLKNKFSQLTDKNFRIVNRFGYLINEKEDIVDNDGRTILTKNMLEPYKGDFPTLYNYQGKPYKISDIIGQLRKDDSSKEIMVKIDAKTNRAVDDVGRPVNANGYLIDEKGNIVNYKREIIWNFWELAYLEPPKIFVFTEFSVSWIKGNLNRDVANFDPRDDELYDLDNRLINTAGYLIDKDENVIDYYGRIVFRKEVLTEKLGQDSEIPKVFLMNILSLPQTELQKPEKSIKAGESMAHDTTGLGRSGLDLERSGMQSSKRVTFRNANNSIFSVNEPESKQASGVRNIKIPLDSPNKSQLPVIQDYESADDDKVQRKAKKIKQSNSVRNGDAAKSRYNRQNSRKSEKQVVKRHGDKVLNLYQQYMNEGQIQREVRDGSPLCAETVSGQQLVPIRLSMQTPTINQGSSSVMRIRNEGFSGSRLGIPRVPLLQNLEKTTQRYASNYRTRQDTSGVFSPPTPPLFAQTGITAVGLLSRGTNGMQHQDPIRMNFNPLLSESLQSGIRVDDSKSYASRAETVFRHTRKILKRDEQMLPDINVHNEARNAVNQQMKSMSNIYSQKLSHKRATSTDF